MRKTKAARVMLDALMHEIEVVKTDDQMTVEAWLWDQLDEPRIAADVRRARGSVA